MHVRIFLAATALLALASACGDDGSSDTGVPSETPQQTPAATGGTSGIPTILDLATVSPLSVVYAISPGDLRSDQPGLAAGDVNGDEIGDVIVGGRFADGPDGRTDSGEAYIILGSENPLSAVDLAADQQDVRIIGGYPGDNLGYSAAIGDLNGDSVNDVILGAPFAGPPDQTTRDRSVAGGAVYMLFGRDEFPRTIDLASTPADVTISGTNASAFFGDSLAAGDINGDGVSDLVIGAPFDSSPGTGLRAGGVHIFFGRDQWPGVLEAKDSDVSLYGAEDADELGDFVASGDINGDSIDDIIATAEAADGPENSRATAAEVHILFGGPEIGGLFDIAQEEQDLTIYGAEPNDTLGFSLAAGDLNGDGIDDLVMGARLANGPAGTFPRAGRVYVLYGRSKLPASVDLLTPPDFIGGVYGPNAATLLGISELVADVDGDGHNDLLMGTGNVEAQSRSHAGAVYVSSAPSSGALSDVNSSALRAVVYGAAADEFLGSNIAATDFNGDGSLELVAVAEGASAADGARPGAGRIYIISLRP